MKGKVTLFFLMVFAAIQIYFARQPMTHQVVGSTWIEVSRQAGAIVERQQGYYLIAGHRVYQLHANSVHVVAKPLQVSWEVVPRPTGFGTWQVAYTRQGMPVIGSGQAVFPSSDGTQVIWKDPNSGLLYQSQGEGDGLSPYASYLRSVGRILWAPDGAAVAVEAVGPEGAGLYVFDGDKNQTVLRTPSPIQDFGFTRQETVLAALRRGKILWQGHPRVSLPGLRRASVDNGVASIWGIHQSQTVLWEDGRIRMRNRPEVTYVGSAEFSENGSDVAVLAENSEGKGELYLDGPTHQWSLRLPYDIAIRNYHLDGFLGNRWVLVSVDSGHDRGTYAWWVNAL